MAWSIPSADHWLRGEITGVGNCSLAFVKNPLNYQNQNQETQVTEHLMETNSQFQEPIMNDLKAASLFSLASLTFISAVNF